MGDEIRSREAWLIAGVLGAATCLLAFGFDFILGRGPHWAFPGGDVQAQLVGYRYFVQDDWHLPLLKTVMIAPPKGVNIIVLDSIPIVALIGKLLRPILGTSFNPYGWWMLAVYVFHAGFAARLVRALGARTRVAAIAAAVFALTFQVFILRFYHQALNAQFVILWAFCLYFERPVVSSPRRFAWGWALMLACGLLVQPYLFAMAFAIFLAACAHGLRFELRTLGPRSLAIVAVVATIVGVALLTGHLSRQMLRGSALCCYGPVSLNVGSLFVSESSHSILAPHASLQTLDQTGAQWEGNMFLGLGVLLLVAVIVVRAPRELGRAIGAHRALAVAVAAMLLFAITNHAFFLDRVLWSFDLPKAFDRLTWTFRAAGRFAWPFGLGIAVGSVALALRWLPRRWALTVLAVCGAIEIVDAVPLLHIARVNNRDMAPRVLDERVFAPALAAHDRIETWPSFECSGAMLAVTGLESLELQWLAANLGRPINNVRAGRPTTNCQWEARSWRPYESRPGALTFYIRATSPIERPASCRAAGMWVICTDQWSRPELEMLRALADRDEPPAYRLGDRLDFSALKPASRYLDGEWMTPVAYEYMSIGDRVAHVRLRMEPTPVSRLVIDLAGVGDPTRLHVAVNRVDLGVFAISPGEHHIELAMPPLAGATELAFWRDAPTTTALLAVRGVAIVSE